MARFDSWVFYFCHREAGALDIFGRVHNHSACVCVRLAQGLAGNPNTPAGILDALLADADRRTLKRLAENPALSCIQLHKVRVRLQDEKMGRPDSSLAKALARCDTVAE